jgi:thiol-disulfide isomerase/thioredoxin
MTSRRKTYSKVSAICCIVLLGVSAVESLVQPLSDVNFEHLTQASTGMTTGAWLIKFFDPGCKYCKELAPVWEDIAEVLTGEINVAEVDCTKESLTCTRFAISGFPQVIFLKAGKQYRYTGYRYKQNILDFVEHAGTDKSDVVGTGIPEPRSYIVTLIADISDRLQRDLEGLFAQNKGAIFFVLCLGIVLGLVAGCAMGTKPKPYDSKKHK